jgi:hypothetical protein
VRVSVDGSDASVIKVLEIQSMVMRCNVVDPPSGNISIHQYHWTREYPQGLLHHINDGSRVVLQGGSLSIMSFSYLNDLGDYQCSVTLSTGERVYSNLISLIPSKSIVITKVINYCH